jgi:hypothetical protein
MVCMPFGSLWLPVLVSAAAVWIASAIVWMALPHHKKDFARVSDENLATDSLRKLGLLPGQYLLPFFPDMQKNMKDPAVVKRLEDGPLVMFRVRKNGVPAMGKQLITYFAYCVLVSFVVAYVARHTLNFGAAGMTVFRLTGTVAIIAYTMSHIPESIWMWRPWHVTWKNIFDGVLYGIITGAIFAGLWPKG